MSIPLSQYWQLLSRYLASQRRRVGLLLALIILGTGLQVTSPLLIGRFIDEVLGDADQGTLTLLALLFIAAAFIAQGTTVLSTWLSETIGWTATNALRADLIAHCLGLDMSFHKTKTPGEMITRLDGDIDALSLFFSQLVLQVLSALLLLAGILVMLTLEEWRIGAAMTVFAVVTLYVVMRLRDIALPVWLRVREKQAAFYGFLGEQLSGRVDIRGNGARTYSMNQLRHHYREWLPLEVRSALRGYGLISAVIHIAFACALVVAVATSLYFWRDGTLTIGSVYLVFHYTEMMRRPIDRIREQVNQLQAAGASIIRVQQLLEVETQVRDDGRTPLPDGPLGVELRGVSFGYQPDDLVLRDISIRLRPGEVLGLLGRTGGGKTTLGRLLVRLYDVTDGELEVGGVPVRDVPLAGLRDRVAVVSQDVQIFEASVRDNLTFYDDSVPDQHLRAALDGLGMREWLDALPDGLDSEISANRLSAGEAQLLACGRAFLRNPGLVILDEATSRLDPATQRLVDAAMARLLDGRTAILIAHRLSTIDRADSIAVLEDGRIVEAGAFAALLADPASRFHRLHALDVEAQTV
jgi:ATP-binding cassette subfamily B protein